MFKVHFTTACVAGLILSACVAAERETKRERPVRLAPELAPEYRRDASSAASAERSSTLSPLPPDSGAADAYSVARTLERHLRLESSAEPALLRIEQSDSDYWRDPEFRRRLNESYISEVDIEPGYNLIEREMMQQVYELMTTDKPDEALALLESSRGPSASAAIDMTVGTLHFSSERLEAAAAAYEVAVQKHPKFRRAWANLGLTYFRLGDHPNAIRTLTRAIEHGASTAINFGLLGFCYLSRDDSIAAESAYRMAILLDPVTEDWKSGLARSFFKQRRYADVIALCDGLLAAKPERHDLWLLQANAYIGLEQPMRAAENYEIVDRLGKLDANNLLTLGDIYAGQELFELAVRAYSRALETDASVGAARPIRAARVILSRGAQEEAAQLVQAIEAAFPELDAASRKDVLRLSARLAVAKGAGDEEARILGEIVELDPLDGDALILLGVHANRSGDSDKAIFYYERAAGIEAFEADAKVRHAQLLVGKGKYSEALVLLRRAQMVKPRENIQKYLEDVERISQGRGQ
jgi:tetratricopeptide (TPR) repeat protein